MGQRFFGQFLVSQGYITPPQLLAAVEYQTKYNARLGELAVALGMLTPFESQHVNAAQVREDRLFGETAVRYGFLTERQLGDALDTQRAARVSLGQALATLGYLGAPTVDAAHVRFSLEQQQAEGSFRLPARLGAQPWVGQLFERAGVLLRRVWNLPNKQGRVHIEAPRLTLSDLNVRARIALPARELSLHFGVPNDVARKVVCDCVGELVLGDSAEEDAVQDFTRVLAECAISLLAFHDPQGERALLTDVSLEGARPTLPPNERVVMVSLLTHLGQVLVGLTV
jgi:hypothetical protein